MVRASASAFGSASAPASTSTLALALGSPAGPAVDHPMLTADVSTTDAFVMRFPQFLLIDARRSQPTTRARSIRETLY